MNDSFPRPVSDPEREGIPETADDDSTAWDDVESPRWADGSDPAPVPPDREDGPLALDEFGVTAEEQRRGEPLDQRLAREEPDVTPDPVPLGMLDDPPVEPHLESEVSTFETLGQDPVTGGHVGRIVAPDEGSGIDEEPAPLPVTLPRDHGVCSNTRGVSCCTLHDRGSAGS
jgi:hypothetical protein